MARILVIAAFILATLCCFYTTAVHAAVIGIDMGAENIVLSTPGRTEYDLKDFNTVEIVLNTQSHRKSANWLGFRNGERFFADDAQNLAARFPDLMTAAPHRFVGLLHNDTSLQQYLQTQHFPYNLKPHPTRGTVVFEYPNAGENGATLSYTAEELLSMMFGHLKRTVEATTRHNEPVTAAVITVPQYFTERQRQAVIDAAAMVGIRVLSLMHPPTAAALQYGIQNDGFKGVPTNVAIVDMGAGSTHVAIYRYGGVEAAASLSGSRANKQRFSTSFGDLTALSVVSSSEISGRVLDACVAKHIEDEFVKKTGLLRILGGATPQQRKSIIALMRAAKKVKETLTANRFALYTVEGMAPEKDFSSRMTREFFDEHCAADAAAAVGRLVDRALEKAGERLDIMNGVTPISGKPLAATAIDRFEVIGGGPRVLKLLDELQSHMGGRKVGRTMNSDEAAAVGVGYRAAAIGNIMRVKGFALQDVSALGQTVSFTVSPLAGAEDAASADEKMATAKVDEDGEDVESETASSSTAAITPLFTVGTEGYLPAHKVVSLGALTGDGAQLTLLYTLASRASAGEVRKDRIVEISGLKSALDTVNYFTDFQKEHNATHTVKVEMSVSEAGIVSLEAASVDCVYYVNVTKTIKVPTVVANDTNGTDSSTGNTTSTTIGEGNATNATAHKPAKVEEETKTIVTVTRRKRTFPLTTKVTFLRSPLPLSMEEARKSKATLKVLDSRDKAALELAATHNDLQSYMIWARGEAFDRYRNKLTEAEKESLAKLLKETNDWVEDDVTDATTRQEVRAKLVTLRDAVRKFMALADDRPDDEKSSGDSDSPFTSAPEPTAISDDIIEDDGVRAKKVPKVVVPPTADGASDKEDSSDADASANTASDREGEDEL